MSVLPEAEQVVIGEDDEMILVATDEPTPKSWIIASKPSKTLSTSLSIAS